MRFNHPEFSFVKPYTTKQIFDKSEIENLDYIKADPCMFTTEDHNWFLKEEYEALASQHGDAACKKLPHIPYVKTEVSENRKHQVSSYIMDIFKGIGTQGI